MDAMRKRAARRLAEAASNYLLGHATEKELDEAAEYWMLINERKA
jgi:hypothetical protein